MWCGCGVGVVWSVVARVCVAVTCQQQSVSWYSLDGFQHVAGDPQTCAQLTLWWACVRV